MTHSPFLPLHVVPLTLVLLVGCALLIMPRPVFATVCSSCSILAGNAATAESTKKSNSLDAYLQDTFEYHFEHQKTWLSDFWQNTISSSLKHMADQLSATALYQTHIVGTFFDAKAQSETQRSLQTLRARAHKDYHPSEGMCRIGSAAKSLAASEHKGEITALVLRKRTQDRTLGNVSALSALGVESDEFGRIQQFKAIYCNPQDHNGQLTTLCTSPSPVSEEDASRFNNDIDFTRVLGAPWTVNIDFTDTQTHPDEIDIFALGTQLYNQPLRGISSAIKSSGKEDLAPVKSFMKARSLLAKHSVAESSFYALAAQKGAGFEGSRDFLFHIMDELGVTDEANINTLLGEKPSYYAQMEVLTKTLYQNPQFYTNLYDKPANVQRKKVALQAIGLMQKFDLLKSQLRSEMNTAVLLELALIKEQDMLENRER